MNKQLIYNIIKHIALWAIYLILPIIIVPRPDVNYIERSQFLFYNYSISSLYSILFFYVNFYWAIPRLAYKNKKWKYLLVLLFFVLMCFAVYKISHIKINFEKERIIYLQFIAALLKLVFVNIVAWVIFFYKRNQEHATAKNQAELAYLKAQVNPHFLFNVLNTVYALAIKKSDNTAHAISQISDMMRYNIEKSQERFVSLNQELEYLEDYIDIQKLRLTTKTKVAYNVQGESSNKHIEPLLLIAFIENAFKYGVSTEKESEIIINIEIVENHLELYIQNDKVRTFSNTIGTGIKNAIKRLNYAYRNRYDLDITDREDYYRVQLSIKLQ